MFWSDSHCRSAKAVETQTNRLGGGNGCRSSGFCKVLRFRGFGILSFGEKTDGKMRHTSIFSCPSRSQYLDVSNFFSN